MDISSFLFFSKIYDTEYNFLRINVFWTAHWHAYVPIYSYTKYLQTYGSSVCYVSVLPFTLGALKENERMCIAKQSLS